jgi:hypothetical protein
MDTTTIRLTKLQKELLEDIVAEALQNVKEFEYSKTVTNSLNDLLNKLEQA